MYNSKTIDDLKKSFETRTYSAIYDAARMNDGKQFYALAEELYLLALEKVQKLEEEGKKCDPDSTKLYAKLHAAFENKAEYLMATKCMSSYKNPYNEFVKK